MREMYFDFTESIQRIEEIEKKIGFHFKALYALLSGPNSENVYEVVVNGEIHRNGGEEMEENTVIVASLHDGQGRILATDRVYVNFGKFVSFDVFSLNLETRCIKPSMIRIYPKTK